MDGPVGYSLSRRIKFAISHRRPSPRLATRPGTEHAPSAPSAPSRTVQRAAEPHPAASSSVRPSVLCVFGGFVRAPGCMEGRLRPVGEVRGASCVARHISLPSAPQTLRRTSASGGGAVAWGQPHRLGRRMPSAASRATTAIAGAQLAGSSVEGVAWRRRLASSMGLQAGRQRWKCECVWVACRCMQGGAPVRVGMCRRVQGVCNRHAGVCRRHAAALGWRAGPCRCMQASSSAHSKACVRVHAGARQAANSARRRV